MMDLIRREKRKYTIVKRDRISIKEKLIRLGLGFKLEPLKPQLKVFARIQLLSGTEPGFGRSQNRFFGKN